MKKLLVFLAVAGVAAFQIYKVTDRKAFERNSLQRVDQMFANLKSGRVADEQEAIALWHTGGNHSPSEQTVAAFARFRAQKGIGAVQSYSIGATTLVEGATATERYVDIDVTVNGKPLKIRARHKRPLEWADVPGAPGGYDS